MWHVPATYKFISDDLLMLMMVVPNEHELLHNIMSGHRGSCKRRGRSCKRYRREAVAGYDAEI